MVTPLKTLMGFSVHLNVQLKFYNLPYSEEMKNTIKTLESHHDEIRNTFTTHYSNGPLEGSNNKIKAIKRASFGYRSFWRFRTRVLYVFKIKTKRALITK